MRQFGIAKFAVTVYGTGTGLSLATPRSAVFGYAGKNDYTTALVISWKADDI